MPSPMTILVLFGLFAVLFLLAFRVASMTISSSISSSFFNAGSSVTITDNGGVFATITVPAAQPGQLTTRTDTTHGTLTMTNSAHGIITGQRFDLFWTGGQIFNCTAGTVAGVSVPFTVTGAGNPVLPANLTNVTVGISTSAPFEVTGSNVKSLAYSPNGPSSNQDGWFVPSTGAADVAPTYVLAGAVSNWYINNGTTNPLAGQTITTIWMSHDNIQAAQTMQAAAITH